MTYRLFLDDIRNPPAGDWIVARDFAHAVDIVCRHGYPQFASLDHDLGDDIPTGMDFAKWLIERDMDHGDMPEDFDYHVHSANVPGGANINGILTSYLKSKGMRS